MESKKGIPFHRKVGFFLGIILFLLFLFIPISGMEPNAQKTAAITFLVASWWITEAIPLPATSLLPLILFPVFGVLKMKDAAAPYANQYIFLLMGGFFIAMAMQKWELDKRIGLYVIKIFGANPKMLILGFIVATSFLSMWISNSATAMMMMPIGFSILNQIKKNISEENEKYFAKFGAGLMLSIAYGASIGGIGTLVGTFPNVIFAGYVSENLKDVPPITFFTWLKIGFPVTILMIPIIWLYITKVLLPSGKINLKETSALAINEIKKLGKMKLGEKVVLIIFIITCFLWTFREDIDAGFIKIPGWSSIFPNPKEITDATVAIAMAILLFIIPIDLKKGEFALDWEWAKKTSWGTLILFGGGFTIGKAFEASGLSSWLGSLIGNVEVIHPLLYIFLINFIVTFLTEVTSNTAIVQILLPIMAAIAKSLNVHPFLLMIPITISASCAFMLPAGTPPNAIVFSTGYVTIGQMAKSGFAMNIIGIILITLTCYFITLPLLGIS